MTTLFDDDIYDIIDNNSLSDLELPYIINVHILYKFINYCFKYKPNSAEIYVKICWKTID